MYSKDLYVHFTYNNRKSVRRTSNYTPGSGQEVTVLHLSPAKEAGLVTHKIMFHKNSFLPPEYMSKALILGYSVWWVVVMVFMVMVIVLLVAVVVVALVSIRKSWF
jgi:hypothetical protein